ncbi:MAG: NfeD family protein [Acidimicrobiales bacterium]
MGWLPDAPAVVLVAITLAAALMLVEVALPTFGLAGTSALALAAVAVLAAGDQAHPWWPLLAVAAAVFLWAVLLIARRPSPTGQWVAAGLFAVGGIGYGVAARDPATIVLAIGGSVALPMAFRPLMHAANRLLELPPQTGMEALIGRTGTVVRWNGRSGTVRVDGSLWKARSAFDLSPGDEVVVCGHTGMTVEVALPSPVP